MSGIPNWVSALIVKQVLKYAPGLADSWQDEHLPELGVAARVIADGGTLRDAIKAYVEATESLSDDEVFEKVDVIHGKILIYVQEVIQAVGEKPFKDVLEQYLGGIEIPDFDDDASNNISVADFVVRLFEELAD